MANLIQRERVASRWAGTPRDVVEASEPIRKQLQKERLPFHFEFDAEVWLGGEARKLIFTTSDEFLEAMSRMSLANVSEVGFYGDIGRGPATRDEQRLWVLFDRHSPYAVHANVEAPEEFREWVQETDAVISRVIEKRELRHIPWDGAISVITVLLAIASTAAFELHDPEQSGWKTIGFALALASVSGWLFVARCMSSSRTSNYTQMPVLPEHGVRRAVSLAPFSPTGRGGYRPRLRRS